MSTATLHSEKKKVLVPQLRFSEFDGKWIEDNLGNITNWASGGTPPKDNPLFWDGDIPWISASSMRGIVYSDSELKITNAGLKKGSKLAKKGSLLILVRGSMLFNKIPIGIVSKDVAFNQDVKSIVVDVNFSTSAFILNWFTAFEPKILNMVTGTGIGAGKLDLPDLKALKISFPTLPEQQKIASFLSAVDEKIQQLSRKKELLEQYKKGVMQQLFSGKLRFKDENGEDYADWEEKMLGDFCTFFSGGTPTSTIQKFYSGTIPFIGSGNIYDSEVFSFISEEALNSSSAKIVEKGDLLYALYGANSGELAISKMNGAINQAILCIRNEESIEYLYYVLILNKDNIVAKFLQGGQGNLSAQIIKRLKYKFPSIKEQHKIANFLSSIDTKIENVNGEIVKTQLFKKGLLQQMFV